MKIALIIFTKNERKNAGIFIPKIPRNAVDSVYCVDGNSTDGTREYCAKQNIPIIEQTYNGVGGAYHAAFSNTTQDALIFFHPDGNMDPNDIAKFVKQLKRKHSFIIASRNIKGGVNEEDDSFFKPRKWFCQTLGFLANTLWATAENHASDITQGYRAITRTAWKTMHVDHPDPIAPDFEQVIIALKKHIHIHEFPTREGKRKYGSTSMKALKTGLANSKVLLKYLV